MGYLKKLMSIKKIYEENQELMVKLNEMQQEKEAIAKDRDWAYGGCGARDEEIKWLKIDKEKLEQEISELKNTKKRNNQLDYEINQPNFDVTFIGSKLPKITIGEGSYSNGTTIYCWDNRVKIIIGKYCCLADNINIIGGGEHDKDWVSSYPFIDNWNQEHLMYLKKPRFKGNIELGNDVWIASNVVILSGVKIGDGAVVGAGAVVTKDIPSYAIVAGNPCKTIRYRFSKEIIDKLLKIKWWEWSKEIINERLQYFSDINEFVNRYYN